jgi:hypothetical protein
LALVPVLTPVFQTLLSVRQRIVVIMLLYGQMELHGILMHNQQQMVYLLHHNN